MIPCWININVYGKRKACIKYCRNSSIFSWQTISQSRNHNNSEIGSKKTRLVPLEREKLGVWALVCSYGEWEIGTTRGNGVLEKLGGMGHGRN